LDQIFKIQLSADHVQNFTLIAWWIHQVDTSEIQW